MFRDAAQALAGVAFQPTSPLESRPVLATDSGSEGNRTYVYWEHWCWTGNTVHREQAAHLGGNGWCGMQTSCLQM